MAQKFTRNTSRKPNDTQALPQKPKKTFFGWIDSTFKVDRFIEGEITGRGLLYLGTFVVLWLLYINLTLRAERLHRDIENTQDQIEENRADYVYYKQRVLREGRQSKTAQKVAEMGLKESKLPPNKIVVE